MSPIAAVLRAPKSPAATGPSISFGATAAAGTTPVVSRTPRAPIAVSISSIAAVTARIPLAAAAPARVMIATAPSAASAATTSAGGNMNTPTAMSTPAATAISSAW
jgi:hypothetical protein